MKSVTQFTLAILLSIFFTTAAIAQPFIPFNNAYFLNGNNQWAGKSQFLSGVHELSWGADVSTNSLNSRLVTASNYTDFESGRFAIYGQGVNNLGNLLWSRDYFPVDEDPEQFNIVTSDIFLGFNNNDVWRVIGDIESNGAIEVFDMALNPQNGNVITARRGSIVGMGDILPVTTPDDFSNNFNLDNILGSAAEPLGGSSMFFGNFKYEEVGVPEDILRVSPNVNDEYMISGISDLATNRFYTIIVDEVTGAITPNGTYKEYFITGLGPIQRVLTEQNPSRSATDDYINVLFTPSTDQIHVVLMDNNRTISLVRSLNLNNLFGNVPLRFNSIESVTFDLSNISQVIITGDALIDLPPNSARIPFEITLNRQTLLPVLAELVPLSIANILFSVRVPRLDRREQTTGWRRRPAVAIDPRSEMRVLESFDTGGLLQIITNGGPCFKVAISMSDVKPDYLEDEQYRNYEELEWDWTDLLIAGDNYDPEQASCEGIAPRLAEGADVSLGAEDLLAMLGVNGSVPPQLLAENNTVRLQLYPNPSFGDEFNLELQGLGEADQRISIEIFDFLGRNIYTDQFNNIDDIAQKTIRLDKDIINGIYLVHVKVGDQYLAVQKLVLERK